jgi:hypothetical protein
MRCKTHDTRLCGNHYCTGLHRLCRNISAEGSLAPETCDFTALNTWGDYLVHISAALVGCVLMAWFLVWL